MFVFGSPCRGRAVLIGGFMQVGTALGVSDDHIPVDERIRRRTLEAVVQPRLLNLEFTLLVSPSAGPSRLVDFGPRGVAGLPPDPSEGIPQRVVTADDKPSDLAHESVKTIGIQRLHALPPGRSCLCFSSEAAAPLVPTPLPSRLEVEGDSEPEASADLELQISEPSGGSRWCGKNPGAGARATAGPEARARSRRQSHEETSSSRFCPAPAEQPLALSQGRSLVLPTPNLGWGFSGDLPGVVQVDAISRELLNSLAESDGPSLSAPRDGLPRCQPGAGQRPDRRERSEPRSKPGLGSKVPEA